MCGAKTFGRAARFLRPLAVLTVLVAFYLRPRPALRLPPPSLLRPPGYVSHTTLNEQGSAFTNPWETWEGPVRLWDILRLFFDRKFLQSILPLGPDEQVWIERQYPSRKLEKDNFKRRPVGGLRLTWLGHSSLLMEVDGFVFLVDPVFSEYASPVQGLGPKRLRPSAAESAQHLREATGIERLDAVLISHAHYDHFDLRTLEQVETTFENVKYYVPWGMGNILNSSRAKIPKERIVEMVWWQKVQHVVSGNTFDVVFTPAQHWSCLGFFDMMTILHGGFVVASQWNRYYYVGDTGYCPVFREIGDKLGPFDLAAIPIGAYEPRWFHRSAHLDPRDAVKVHVDVKSKLSLGVHWGTFRLTSENFTEPPRFLKQELIAQGVGANEFTVPELGIPRAVVV